MISAFITCDVNGVWQALTDMIICIGNTLVFGTELPTVLASDPQPNRCGSDLVNINVKLCLSWWTATKAYVNSSHDLDCLLRSISRKSSSAALYRCQECCYSPFIWSLTSTIRISFLTGRVSLDNYMEKSAVHIVLNRWIISGYNEWAIHLFIAMCAYAR